MKYNGLYELLNSIMNCYSEGMKEYEIDSYSYPNMTTKFGTGSGMLFKRKNNCIEIYFNGKYIKNISSIPEEYKITVFNNDVIKHNIPMKRGKLFREIVSFINKDVYRKAREDKHRILMNKIDKAIKEMNRNPKIDEYKEMAKEILFELGKVYRTDDVNNDNEGVTQSCSYSGYGLKIEAYDLPGYVFEDGHNGLQDFIKKYMDKIIIKYKDKYVLDTNNDNYTGGIWEDIFKELYSSLSVLKYQKDDNYQNKLHCKELLKNTIKPLTYKGIRKINESLIIDVYNEDSYRINNCGSFETDHHYSITKDGKEVFHVIDNYPYDIIVYNYKPGYWEQELKNYLIKCKEEEKQKDIDDGLEYIKQLRRLR